MGVRILHQKRCCTAPTLAAIRGVQPSAVPMIQAGPGDNSIRLQALRDTGRLGPTCGHSKTATSGQQPQPWPWGPRAEDQPWIDTEGKTRTHAAFLSRQCHVDGETKGLPLPAIGG